MFIATRSRVSYGSSGAECTDERTHRAPLERGPSAGRLTIYIWSLRDSNEY